MYYIANKENERLSPLPGLVLFLRSILGLRSASQRFTPGYLTQRFRCSNCCNGTTLNQVLIDRHSDSSPILFDDATACRNDIKALFSHAELQLDSSV
jgi:hypothetical protein